MKIEVGNKVESKKFGIGTITRIITKSTGYVEVDYNGILKNEMAFNLVDLNGESLKKKPVRSSSPSNSVVREYDVRRIEAIVCEGDYAGNIFLSACLSCDIADEKIKSICNYGKKYTKISPKQAYCLAVFAEKNNIEIK